MRGEFCGRPFKIIISSNFNWEWFKLITDWIKNSDQKSRRVSAKLEAIFRHFFCSSPSRLINNIWPIVIALIIFVSIEKSIESRWLCDWFLTHFYACNDQTLSLPWRIRLLIRSSHVSAKQICQVAESLMGSFWGAQAFQWNADKWRHSTGLFSSAEKE